MNRIKKLEQTIEDLEISIEEMKARKKRKFKMPFRAKAMMKADLKRDDTVLVLYLTQKYQARFRLEKVLSGNIIVIDNKSHKLNPKAMYSFGKNRFYVVREIDRRPVSNLDYNKVIKRGHGTDDDPVLIKAVLGAVQKKKLEGKIPNAKIVLIVIGIIIAGAVIFSFFQ